jgi:hypothetical protein
MVVLISPTTCGMGENPGLRWVKTRTQPSIMEFGGGRMRFPLEAWRLRKFPRQSPGMAGFSLTKIFKYIYPKFFEAERLIPYRRLLKWQPRQAFHPSRHHNVINYLEQTRCAVAPSSGFMDGGKQYWL